MADVFNDTDADSPPSQTSYGRALRSLDNIDAASSSHNVSPQPRSSTDSLYKAPTKAPSVDQRETMSVADSGSIALVDPSFDEKVLRALCDLDVRVLCSLPYFAWRLSSMLY
jgi:hypothetical protein